MEKKKKHRERKWNMVKGNVACGDASTLFDGETKKEENNLRTNVAVHVPRAHYASKFFRS